jgi:hypothetical protein
MINRRCFITGVKSLILSNKEKNFLIKYKPWGVILFSRNIKSITQTKKLTDDIKKIFKDEKYPILLDQEGGRVNRLSKFTNNTQLTAKFFGDLYKKDIKKFNEHFKIFINETSFLMKKIGININTVPVLDIRSKGSNNVIGDRSFSSDPKVINKIGIRNKKFKVCIDSKFIKGKMNYGEILIPGKSKKEILISTYICHPSMANDNLSGVILTSLLVKYIKSINGFH